MRWGKTWRLLQKVTYYNKADYSADCFAAAEVLHILLTTKMRNIAGLSTSEAQKSSDMFGKCRYLDEITGGRGVVFATGTPVSNSMSELYTVMRYLQYGTLQQKGLTHFDCWASTFGETTTAIELAPEGTGYRARTRFAKFFNLPELMAMFKEVADIKTSDQLHLPVPEAKFETVVVKPSEIQKEMVQNLSERAAKVHSGTVDASEDNMLCITNDGRKIGLDQRLMNPLLPDDPASKLNACVRNVLQIWEDGREQKLTQLLFCDLSTPKNDGQFNVYDDIKTKLLAAGVPESEVAFIHSADTEAKKRRHCSPKCAPAMCGFCWAALQKWVQAPMCRTGLWRCIIWMSAGNPVI